MSILEVSCIRNGKDGSTSATQQLQNVTSCSFSTVRYPFQKLKDQAEQYGDGRLVIIRADDSATFSPYETTTWTKVEAWCKDPKYGKTYSCYLFIEHHFNMKHTISFIHV